MAGMSSGVGKRKRHTPEEVVAKLRQVAERWRLDYNHRRPHSSLDYQAPAAFAAAWDSSGSAALRLRKPPRKCDIVTQLS